MSNKNLNVSNQESSVGAPSPSQIIAEWTKEFNRVDKKKCGRISVEDARKIMEKFINYDEISDDESQVLEDEVGSVTKNGEISLQDLVNILSSHLLTSEEDDVIRAFKVFDKENTGELSCAEFRHILTNLGDRFNDDEVNEIFREANLTDESTLNYEEFVQFWKSK